MSLTFEFDLPKYAVALISDYVTNNYICIRGQTSSVETFPPVSVTDKNVDVGDFSLRMCLCLLY